MGKKIHVTGRTEKVHMRRAAQEKTANRQKQGSGTEKEDKVFLILTQMHCLGKNERTGSIA